MPGGGEAGRVLPPQVPPDLLHRTQGGTHYNSIGADDSFPPPPSPLVTAKSPSRGQ